MEGTAPKKDALEMATKWSKLQDRSGVTYLPNTDKPFSGYVKRVYDTEQVEVLAEFDGGYVVRLQQWQENGTPRWDIGYMQGKVGGQDVPLDDFNESNSSYHQGLVTLWYENGQKSSEENYKDGKWDGIRTDWYENGQKRQEQNYKDGERDGLQTWWRENGQKRVEQNWKARKRDGLSTSWYKNGQKRQEQNYKDGKLMSALKWKPNGEKCPVTNLKDGNGVMVGYYEKGQKMWEANYKDGKRDGLETEWYENGQKGSEQIIKDDKCISAQVWKPNGEKCPATNLKDGNGVVVLYFNDGSVYVRETYKDGELVEDEPPGTPNP